MANLTEINLSKVARGKVRASKIVLREESLRYLNKPKKTRKLKI